MTFYGHSIERVKRKRVSLPYNLHGEPFQVLCIKTDADELYLMVCPLDSESPKEIPDTYEILQKDICNIRKTLTLPELFLAYLDGNDVVVGGARFCIELFSEPYYFKSTNLAMEGLTEIFDEIGL